AGTGAGQREYDHQQRHAVLHRGADRGSSASSTMPLVSTVGSFCPRPSTPGRNTTYSGTPGESYSLRNALISGSTLVQSPCIATVSVRSSNARKASVCSTAFSLTLQVTHQSAVMSTNTPRPSARRLARRSAEYAT